MMKFLIVLSIVCYSLSCSAQTPSPETVFKQSQNIGDDVSVTQRTLVDLPQRKIYLFQILGSHNLPFILTGNGNNGYEIIKKYDIESLILQMKKLLPRLSEREKLDFLSELIEVSRAHLETEGWELLEDG